MIHLHTEFHLLRCTGSLVIAILLKAKFRFHMASVTLHSTLHHLHKNLIFSRIFYHTKFKEPTLNYTSVAPTAQVLMAAMLVLLMVGN
jgi:hypothetical protein